MATLGSPVTGAPPGAGTPRRSGDEPLPSPLPPPSFSSGAMTNPDGPAVPAGQTEAAATAATKSAAAAAAAAEETAAAAEATAVAASARAASAAAEAVVAEAAAAAAKAAARPTTLLLVAGGPAAPGEVLGVKPTHIKAPEWAGPDGFLQYKEDVEVWLHMTTLPDDKKGGAMRLALTGVAKEAARNVSVAQVTSPTGHKALLTCLRVIFAGSESQRVTTPTAH